ncbi:GNAT family N-acetyltransferase [Nocardia thailandica]|uniref:GNAT family N-acetyltransferase n=1 Tax=Nocardia thailandica TaxID=257275 RepID=A0ABW6PQD0_9NOCA
MARSAAVQPAERGDADVAARVLAAAFQEDPVMSWILPDARRRSAGLPHFFRAAARHLFLPAGGSALARGADGAVAGAALWTPPGTWPVGAGAQVRALPGMLRGFGRRIGAGKRVGDLLEHHHPAEPHWYLAMIGTSPAARGAGHGYALMRAGLDRADADRAPAYLESSNPANVPYYERFGFDVLDEIVVPGGPPLWRMWRAAR